MPKPEIELVLQIKLTWTENFVGLETDRRSDGAWTRTKVFPYFCLYVFCDLFDIEYARKFRTKVRVQDVHVRVITRLWKYHNFRKYN